MCSQSSLFITTVCALLAWSAPFVARAATVSPGVVDVMINPGSHETVLLSFKNSAAHSVRVLWSVVPFQADGERGDVTFDDRNMRQDDWIHFDASTTLLKADEELRVPVQIAVPRDVIAGGYERMIVATEVPQTPSAGVTIWNKIGVPVLIRVNGPQTEQIRIASFAMQRRDASMQPTSFMYRAQNLGSVHERPEAQLVMRNMIGRTVQTVDANALNAYVLPQAVRAIAVTRSSSGAASGWWGKAMQEFSERSFGRYSATLTLHYGAPLQETTAELSYWVFPWHAASVIAAVIIALALLLRIQRMLIVHAALRRRVQD